MMKRVWIVAVLFSLLLPTWALAQNPMEDFIASGLPSLPGISLGQVKLKPFVQAGFQRVGSNLTLPVEAERLLPFIGAIQIDTMDITLKDANFWSGTAGVNVTAGELFSVFAAGGGILPRTFAISGEMPVSVGPLAAVPVLDFTSTKAESWFVQVGAGLGPIIGGMYWDHFIFEISDPRIGSVPLANQTLRGDTITKSACPFFGIVIPASGATATIIYSPWAWSNTVIALRSSQNRQTELKYSWNRPGDFVSATFQYNTALLSSSSFGLWANYTWMRVVGDAELEFENSAPAISTSKDVTATMTKYVLGGGITLGIQF
ncbi:MAG: hypothetical protein AB1664_13355 [Thermodesulfobacteriota bacterium]